MTEFISTFEAAGLLGVHQTTIHRWIRSGQLKAKKLGPGRKAPDNDKLSAAYRV